MEERSMLREIVEKVPWRLVVLVVLADVLVAVAIVLLVVA